MANGVNQGRVLETALPNMMFGAILKDVFSQEDIRVELKYCKDAHLLNHRYFQATMDSASKERVPTFFLQLDPRNKAHESACNT